MGVTTIGFRPLGNNVTAPADNISATAPGTKALCSIAEGALYNSISFGATTVHKSRYPSSIQVIATGLRTKARQNDAQLATFPFAIAP